MLGLQSGGCSIGIRGLSGRIFLKPLVCLFANATTDSISKVGDVVSSLTIVRWYNFWLCR